MCTASGVVPFRTAVMHGSVRRAQPRLPGFVSQQGHLSRLSVDVVCEYRFLFVSTLVVTLGNKTLAKGFQQKLYPGARKS